MDTSKTAPKLAALLLSFLLAFNCFGTVGFAYSDEVADQGQEEMAETQRAADDSAGDGKAAASGSSSRPSDEEGLPRTAPGKSEAGGDDEAEGDNAAAGEQGNAADQAAPTASSGASASDEEQGDNEAAGERESADDGKAAPVAGSGASAPDEESAGDSTDIEEASSETVEEDVKNLATRKGEGVRVATSSDLSDFLTEAIIDAPQDENGSYIINPNSSYSMTLRFSERESLQFDDEAVLHYDFPEGVLAGDFGATTFPLTLNDENGLVTIEGNTFEVVDGQLRVRFNTSDPGFERLKAAPNANFGVTISSRFDESAGQIVFNADIIKDFVFEETSDLTIDKAVAYDINTDTASYELVIRSSGANDNVVIQDTLTGTALIFNQDVVIESSIGGVLSATPDYTAIPNGFRVTIPHLADGETLTLRYTAAVDNTKITANGTVEQTQNTARVASDQVPDGKEASADFAGQAKFHRVEKSAAGDPVPVGENLYEQTWTIDVNKDHKVKVGGTSIYDWIVANSRPFMSFTGDGIVVEVTYEDGTAETRTVPWDDLQLYTTDAGATFGWAYDAPESDGKASYHITCTTLIDTSAALGSLTLVNGAQVYGSYDEGKVSFDTIGTGDFAITKEAVGTTSRESEWKITVTVPGEGLPDLRVVDDLPKLAYDGQEYVDTFVDGSMTVEGLQDGESWDLYVGSAGKSYTLTFYQDEAHEHGGILPTPDGKPRDIVIHFKTAVNQEWLALAAEDGYESTNLAQHTNVANARSGSYRTDNVRAYVIPVRPNLVKSFLERTEVEVDGVTLPAFKYRVALFGPTEDGAVIHESFNTEYLALYEEGGVRIAGGNDSNPTDESGGSVSVASTEDGADIAITSFPKQENGSFYPYYELSYTLVVRDQSALAALNAAAAASQGGIDLTNTASWGDLSSSRVVNYTYFPYVDKDLLERPSAENGYIAQFQIVINKYAEDLDPESDELTIQDELSPNLRLLPDSLVISPANDAISVQYDSDANTLTFAGVPDETTLTVTYQARVLGGGNTTYSNTVKFGKFEKTVTDDVVIESSGGGSASNPSITVVKRDSEDLSTTLAGATFLLCYLNDDGTRAPVLDRNGEEVTFTTGADGKVLIVGNLQSLGWTLWEGRTYCLVETAAPVGYEINDEPVSFKLAERPSSQLEYAVTGDQLSVTDNRTTIDIPVSKAWIGPVGSSEVTVHLLANGEDTGNTLTLSESGGWTDSFKGLREYDDSGTKIAYSVAEDPIAGYASEPSATGDGGWAIVNASTETIDIPIAKTWVGPAAKSATFKLLADGETVEEVVLGEADGWRHTFSGLQRYDRDDGHEISYDVVEEDIPGYATNREGSVAEGFTFTNTNVEEVEISGTKTWDDADNQDGLRPESITVHLKADGTEIGSLAVTAAEGWAWAFEGYPKYDASDGHAIVYSIVEDQVDEYETDYDGYDIVNTHIPETTAVEVSKVWADDDDREGIRPDSVTFHLLADGSDTGERLTVTAAEGWTGSFTDLDAFRDGERIAYTVEEEAVDGYTAIVTGDAQSGFTVKNTHEPGKDESGKKKTSSSAVPPTKRSTPKTGDSMTGAALALAAVAVASTLIFLSAKRRKGEEGGIEEDADV